MKAADLTAVVLAMVLLAAPAGAQVRAGGHVLYKSQAFDGDFGVGARAEADLGFVRRGLVVAGLYERVFPECSVGDCSFSEFGGQLLLAPQGPIYFGLGAGYRQYEEDSIDASVDDTWNFSFAAGVRLTGWPLIVPFLEYRQEFAGSLNEQTFSLGVLLSPTGSRAAPRRPAAP